VLAILQLSDGRHEEAIQSGERAVALKPNDAEAYTNLGMVLSYAGHADAAVAATEHAMLLNPLPSTGPQMLAGIVFYNAGQYDRAVAALEPVAKIWADSETPHEYLAAAYHMLGRAEDARREISKMPGWPGMNQREFRRVYEDFYRNRDDLDRLVRALAASGLPEWPLGFAGRPEDQVKGAELETLRRGQLWTGASPVRRDKSAPFMLQIDDKGRVAYRGVNTFLTGQSRIEGDQLCMKFEGYLKDRWVCGNVFRNRAGKAGADGYPEDYVYVLSDGLRYFSLKPK